MILPVDFLVLYHVLIMGKAGFCFIFLVKIIQNKTIVCIGFWQMLLFFISFYVCFVLFWCFVFIFLFAFDWSGVKKSPGNDLYFLVIFDGLGLVFGRSCAAVSRVCGAFLSGTSMHACCARPLSGEGEWGRAQRPSGARVATGCVLSAHLHRCSLVRHPKGCAVRQEIPL